MDRYVCLHILLHLCTHASALILHNDIEEQSTPVATGEIGKILKEKILIWDLKSGKEERGCICGECSREKEGMQNAKGCWENIAINSSSTCLSIECTCERLAGEKDARQARARPWKAFYVMRESLGFCRGHYKKLL